MDAAAPIPAVATTGERLEIPVEGGRLVLTRFVSSARAPRACVVVNGAMGVVQRFYRPFAEYLAQSGWVSVTWDYRGIGESVLDPSDARRVSLAQWAFEDFSLVLAEVRKRHPTLPIVVVGHSFGGQIIALPANRDEVRAALLVACPSGYVGHWKGRRRGRFMWWLAHVGIPVLARVSGKFPAARLGLGADLPPRVALEWGQWLRHPQYLARSPEVAARMASFRAPLRALSMDDDEYAPPEAVAAMLSLYRGADLLSRVVSASAQGLSRIGHMGFFRQRASPGLWNVALDEIEALIAEPARQPAASPATVPRAATSHA